MRLRSRRRRWRSWRAGLGDEHQAGDDDKGANPAGDALARGSQTFGGDDGRHDRHCAQVHDANRQHDHRGAGGAAAAVQAEAQAVPPGGASICGQHAAGRGLMAAAREVMRFPRRELQRAGHQHDHTHRDRHGARDRLLLHFNPRQDDAHRERRDAQHDPDEEVAAGNDRRQPPEAGLRVRGARGGGRSGHRLAIAPQHRDERRQHHRHHHHQPHADKRRPQTGPGLSRHPHPRHRHRPAARHRHAAHGRHRLAPDRRQRCARDEEQR